MVAEIKATNLSLVRKYKNEGMSSDKAKEKAKETIKDPYLMEKKLASGKITYMARGHSPSTFTEEGKPTPLAVFLSKDRFDELKKAGLKVKSRGSSAGNSRSRSRSGGKRRSGKKSKSRSKSRSRGRK